MRFLLPVLALLLILCNTTHAQGVAFTRCEGTDVRTFINVAILDTDSTQEILAHEAEHRRQADSVIALHGACVPLSPLDRVAIEAGAYCVSDSVRVVVKKTPPFEASAISLYRLLQSFYPSIPADSIVATWKRVCP